MYFSVQRDGYLLMILPSRPGAKTGTFVSAKNLCWPHDFPATAAPFNVISKRAPTIRIHVETMSLAQISFGVVTWPWHNIYRAVNVSSLAEHTEVHKDKLQKEIENTICTNRHHANYL